MYNVSNIIGLEMDFMGFMRFALGADLAGFDRRLREYSAASGKSLFRLRADYAACLVRYGAGFCDYLGYGFPEKKAAARREYATIRDQDRFYARVSPERYKKLFTVKYDFLDAFSKYAGREWTVPERDGEEAFLAFVGRHPVFIEKPYDGLAGRGVRKVRACDMGDPGEYCRYMAKNRLFAEELLSNHPDIAAFAPESCNTVRVVTVNSGSRAELLCAAFRCGTGADVDNFHAGGLCCMVGEDGSLAGPAVGKDGREYDRHPVSGLVFDGFRLPMWEETKAVCLEASFVNTDIHVVGWDAAVTPSGVSLIEGNRRPGFDLLQMASRRGLKPLLKRARKLAFET